MYRDMRHYKQTNAQVGRLFRKGSFFDKLLHVAAAFFPPAAPFILGSDVIGDDEGFFGPKKPTPPDELSVAGIRRTTPKVI
jgi:hypothetical protein